MNNIISLFIKRKDFFLNLLWQHVGISFFTVVTAVIIGGMIGIFISEHKKLAKPVLGIINFVYTIPSISLLGFFIPLSGIGNQTAVIVLVIYALLPMVRNTYTGIEQVDPLIVEAATGLGSTPRQVLTKVKLPLALPFMMAGIRNMAVMTIALAGIASFIGAGGLGVAIYRGITTNNATMTLIGSLMIAIFALVVDFVLSIIEKRIKSKKQQSKKGIIGIIILVCLVLITQVFQQKQEVLHIATKPMTEQYILGEMLDIYIEQETNLKVELTQGVGGGTSNIVPAMKKGEFDLYPEYTGTGWNAVLKKNDIYSENLFKQMNQEYKKKLKMEWIGQYGFNNTYGLAVRKEISERYQLKTYSDLSKVADQLIFGGEYDFFEREDGYDALCKTYHMNFKKTVDLDIGLKYKALKQGNVDVMTIFTTDGQLANDQIVVLKDDLHFYPSYLCGNVIRSEVLKKHPELKKVLKDLSNIISDDEMAYMNHQVESQGQEPRDVAKRYLKEKKLLKES